MRRSIKRTAAGTPDKCSRATVYTCASISYDPGPREQTSASSPLPVARNFSNRLPSRPLVNCEASTFNPGHSAIVESDKKMAIFDWRVSSDEIPRNGEILPLNFSIFDSKISRNNFLLLDYMFSETFLSYYWTRKVIFNIHGVLLQILRDCTEDDRVINK